MGEIGHQHMQAPLAAAISPWAISPNTWIKWGLTTTPGIPCPTCDIPWHISVAFRKRAEQNDLRTFCHIFKSWTQDSRTVLAVVANVVQQRKYTMPRMHTVFYQQGQCWLLPLRCQHCWSPASIPLTFYKGTRENTPLSPPPRLGLYILHVRVDKIERQPVIMSMLMLLRYT